MSPIQLWLPGETSSVVALLGFLERVQSSFSQFSLFCFVALHLTPTTRLLLHVSIYSSEINAQLYYSDVIIVIGQYKKIGAHFRISFKRVVPKIQFWGGGGGGGGK